MPDKSAHIGNADSERSINEFLSQLRGIFAIQRPPAKLYHYTSTTGLKGIVESNRLWASSIYYLNDASELQYGYSLLRSALNDVCGLLENDGFELKKAVMSRALEKFHDPIQQYPDIYVCCFCEDQDVLSMWRTYGAQGGYAIEFCLSKDNAFQVAAPNGSELFFRQVDYDRESQQNKIRLACGKFIDMLRDLDKHLAGWTRTHPVEETGIDFMVYLFQELLVLVLPSFKHPAFKDEREWRVVIRKSRVTAGSEEWKLHFRTGNLGLVSYVEMSPDTLYGTLPITRIVCGPSSHPELTKNSARLLLSSDFPRVAVEGTTIPARM